MMCGNGLHEMSEANSYRGRCRACRRAQGTARHDQRREILREAKSRPCADCGGVFPYYVMDLDHRPGVDKVLNVAKMAARYGLYSLDDLRAEIAKCDVVCANCHRVRTHERDQY